MTTTLFRGGPVYSPADPFATALLVEDEAVAWVGSADAAPEADSVVELAGALVAPAFVDAHVHTTATGLALTGLDLSAARSLAEALGLVAAAARAAPGLPLLGGGWDETSWSERRAPTVAELDRAAAGAVVYLARVDRHCAVVSNALRAAVPEAAGLAGFAADGPVRLGADRRFARVAYGTLTPAQRRDAQRAARARAAELGIGCLHEMGGPDLGGEPDLAGLLALARDEPGPQVVGYWGELAAVDRARELGAHGCAGDLLVDGSLGSHTALLSAPYADAPTRGHAYLDADDVARHLGACADAGLQAGFHAIGDAALATVCAGLARGHHRPGGGLARTGPVRVEHAECPDEATIGVLASCGVLASVQPAFDARWGGPSGTYAQRLGPARARAMNPFAAMAAAGVPFAFGSDAPVTPLDPWGAIRAAVRPSTPAHAMSARAAFAAHTRGGWRATGSAPPGDAGVLVPGAPATLAVWSAGDLVVQAPDPRVAAWSTDPRAGIPGLPDLDGEPPVCLRTLVRGRTVYESPGAAG
ncbi:MAG TPA: amidohydrolase family protein [Mycobacteriales bacterium]|nr:amidohydrolase family protein [Mycobacteriales bacterium]